VVANAALSFGWIERWVSGDDVKLEVDGAWTVWPGTVHAESIRVYLNGNTQLTLSVADATVDVVLTELLTRRFHASSLEANDIRFRLRTRVPESKQNDPYVAAFPPMPELPGDAGIVRQPKQEKENEEEEKDKSKKWTVRIDNIDAEMRELWFLQYRYLGGGRVRGGFMKNPERFSVANSVQELSPGQLSFGEKQVISKNFRGRVQGHIPEIDPSDRGVLGLFAMVDADIRLDGDLLSLAHLGDYLKNLRVEGGDGPLKIRLGMQAGKLGPATRIDFATDEVRVIGDGYSVASDCELTAFMGKAEHVTAGDPSELPRLRSRAKLSTLSWARDTRAPFTLQLHDHEESAALSSLQIDQQTTLGDFYLHFPRIFSGDLDDLDNLLGPKRPIDSKRGSLRGNLTLTQSERGSLQGPLRLRFNDASVGFLGLAVGASGRLEGYLDVDLHARAAAIGKLSAELRPVTLRAGDARVSDWWLRLESPRVSTIGWPPERVTADLSIVAKDAEPILTALAKKDEVPEVVAKLIDLDNLKVEAKLRKRPGIFDIVLDDVESDVLDLTGRVRVDDKHGRYALVVGGKSVSLGIFKNGGDTELEAQAGQKWLTQKLQSFPPAPDGVRAPRR